MQEDVPCGKYNREKVREVWKLWSIISQYKFFPKITPWIRDKIQNFILVHLNVIDSTDKNDVLRIGKIGTSHY